MSKLIKHILTDLVRNRVMIAYLIFLLVSSLTIFNMQDTAAKGIVSMLNIILWIIPMISMVFSAIYLYNSSEFIELLLSQPLQRRTIWSSLFVGLAISFTVCFIIGYGIPMLLYANVIAGWITMLAGIFLSLIFVAIAMLIVVQTRDKARGIGKVILLWLYFSIIFNGLILMFIFQFADYPIEKPMVILSFFNPIDLARIMALLQLDISALMGFTGSLFREFFGSISGQILSIIVMIIWILIPYFLSLYKFNRKDL